MRHDSDQIITVTGDLGSGKSRTCCLLAERLQRRVVSTGTIQRQLASEMGLTTLELNRLSESDPSIDHRIDQTIQALAGTPNLICDSRLAWHFLPQSLKVCLTVDLDVAAARVLSDEKRTGERYQSLAEAKAALQARRTSEVQRFARLYNIQCDDVANFDLVIDTSAISLEAVVARIIAAL
jgi:CMP/dCMP kinase